LPTLISSERIKAGAKQLFPPFSVLSCVCRNQIDFA
jgi:hypothetical protein